MKEIKYTEEIINEIGILLGAITVKGRENHQYIEKIYQLLESGAIEEIKEDEVGDE